MVDGVIATVSKNRSEHVRVTLTALNGHEVVDIRVFCNGGGAAKPTKAGVCLGIERLPELRAALRKAEVEAVRLGLIKKR